MPLLEVIRHPGTSEETLATTVAVGRTMGKTVIVVGDGPGFFTSRVLVARHVSEEVHEALGDRVAPPPIFERMIADRRLGRKTKRD